MTEPLDSMAFSADDIESPRELFGAIQEEANRRRQFENSIIKLGIQTDSSKPISKTLSQNDAAISGLLNTPERIDGWFEAIDDMASEFYKNYGRIPNRTQAWCQLSTNPPHGYVITTGNDKGEDCLNMPGEKPLSKTAFMKRWDGYTK